MHELWTLSGTRLASMIRQREVTARDVVDAHIQRVERVNPVLNAVVKDRFDDARHEADAADARVRAHDGDPEALPPFLGVPCSIKECFALTGMPQSSGLVARKAWRAPSDAPTVARLRAAGAIPLGVTNTSELCMWMETNNRVYGRTNNPYDPTRIVGGSSGGEGAIIGAGGSPFGLGSDIGGSIRMPAFFNGVFGHKPTSGLVPGTGQHPIAENDALRYLCTGPLARHAEDLFPLLRILAGPDGEDSACEAQPLGDPATVRFADVRVYDLAGDGVHKVAPDLAAAQRAAGDALRAAGATLEPLGLSGFANAFDIWSSSLDAAGGQSFSSHLGEGTPINGPLQLLRWALRSSPHTLPAIVLALTEKLPAWMPARARRAVDEGRALRAALTERLGPNGVLLYPSYTAPAPKHLHPLRMPFDWVYTAIFNILGVPVTQVPLGLNAAGLPLGVQVVAAPGNDHLTIACALELERRFGGWVPPRNLAARAR